MYKYSDKKNPSTSCAINESAEWIVGSNIALATEAWINDWG